VRRRGAAAAAVVDRGAAEVLVDRGAAGGAGDRGEEGERRERRKSGSDLGRPRSSRVRAEAEPSREGVADTRAGNESIDYLLGGGGLRASGGLPAAAPRGGCFASEGGDESFGGRRRHGTWNERRWSDAVRVCQTGPVMGCIRAEKRPKRS
jgi:hypothetical protein